MPTATSVDVANMALSHVGEASITSLSDDNARANACNTWYDWARVFTLTYHPWTFAAKRALLIRHDHPFPEAEWAYRYKYPSDALFIRKIIHPTKSVAYKIPFTVEEGDFSVVAEPEFNADDDWTVGSGWEIGAGVATATTASTAIEQTIATELTEGVTYTLTFTVTRTAGSVTANVGGTDGSARSTSATFEEDIVAGDTDVLKFTGSGFTGTIDTVSLKPAASKTILTNLDDAHALYTLDLEALSRYSPLGIQALSFALAHAIAYELTGKRSIKEAMMRDFDQTVRKASSTDANEGLPQGPPNTDWILARTS